jgi:sugar phosphate isomerase/epimerase
MADPRPLTRRDLLGAAAAAALGAASRPAGAIEPIARPAGSHMKLACAAYSFRQALTAKPPRLTLPQFLERCASWDLDAAELTSYYFPPEPPPAMLHDLRRRAFRLGLSISGVPVRNTFTLPPGPERDRELDHVLAWVRRAAELGAPCVRVFAGTAPRGVPEEQARRSVVECLERACEDAGQYGVTLALENHGGVVATADGLLEIIRAVKSDWLGVNLDTGNFRSADPYADLERVAPYAVTVQIKTEVFPASRGRQEADLARVIQILRRARYRGYITLEYEAREDPEAAVPRYLARLRTLLPTGQGQ